MKQIQDIKTDCFACMVRDGKPRACFALSKLECAGCGFYKHSDNPEATRQKIMEEMNAYSGRMVVSSKQRKIMLGEKS